MVADSTVADGSSSPYVSYLGTVVYDDKRVVVEVEVQPNCKVLLGMSFLEELGLSLLVDIQANRVELRESTKIER